MQKKLIFFTHGGGRFANQLTNYAHLLAFWKEHEESFDIINLAFSPYANLFEKTQENVAGYLPTTHRRLHGVLSILSSLSAARISNKKTVFNQVLRLTHGIFSLLPFSQSIKKGEAPNFLPFLAGKTYQHLNFDSEESLNILRSKNITVLAGWPIRSWTLFRKYEKEIRGYFSVRSEYARTAERFIDSVRKKHDLVIGILLRQSDYRTWNDGKYFFETEQYVEWMRQAQTLFNTKNVGFVISSDEQQSDEKFRMVNAYLTTGASFGSLNFIENFSELSLCDYIMTPPSTFGVWGAFIGNIPIIPLYAKSQIIIQKEILFEHIFDAVKHPHMSQSIK